MHSFSLQRKMHTLASFVEWNQTSEPFKMYASLVSSTSKLFNWSKEYGNAPRNYGWRGQRPDEWRISGFAMPENKYLAQADSLT